ncbi:MFS transporter, partial [Rhodococcus sp. IEGM 1366]|uniref:MFS transporter n=1 Tax=Rhodococcus sp. IEGM 1366 TaxID=3082223 RepID=UPI002955D450
WRVMFLLSAPLALVAVFIRMRLAESPVFKELAANSGLARRPLKEALTANPRRLLSGTLYMIGYFGGAIMLLFFMPTYLTKDLGMAVTDTSLLMAGATLTFALLIPIFGWLTDILTRFQARVLSTSLHALISLPAFLLISGNATGAIVFGLILLATLQAFYYAIGPLTVVDIFPARIRFTSGTIVMNVPVAIVPAILPPLAAVATTMTGLSFAPALVAVGLSLVGLIGAIGLRSAGQPTR